MKIAGAIVAGGSASRMGGAEKPLLPLGGTPLFDALLPRLRRQVDAIALNVRPQARARYRAWEDQGIPMLTDPYHGAVGPLGGVVAGLTWLATLGREYAWLATFPGDAPFLPDDLVERLTGAIPSGETPQPVVAFDGARIQSLCALWPRNCLGRLRQGIATENFRSVQRALDALGCIACFIDDRASFLNINTPDDLAEAERLYRRAGDGLPA